MKIFFALIPLLLLAGCTSSIDPMEPPNELATIGKPELEVSHLWVRQQGKGSAGKQLKLTVHVDGERVFSANHAGRVEAISREDGNELWRNELKAAINSGPGDGGDLLLLGGNAEVIALQKKDGSISWRTPVSSEVLSIPQRKGNIVVVHSVDGNITALDATSGKRLWQHRESVPALSLRGSSDPYLLDTAVLIGTANGKVIALSLDDGRVLWETVVAEPRGRTEVERVVDVDAELAVGNGVVHAASYQESLVTLSLESGQLLWSRDIGSSSGMVIDGAYLYVSDVNGDLWALSRRDGETMWKQDALHRRGLSAPVQQGNYLIVGDFEGYLHWVDKEDGHLVGRSRVRNLLEYWPVDDVLDDAYTDYYEEDRSVHLAPAVEGRQVFGLDKRGVLDAYRVSPVAAETE
ncbi:MAG: outer membrane protein assembly factor BamB [Pseudomonadota bacterium]